MKQLILAFMAGGYLVGAVWTYVACKQSLDFDHRPEWKNRLMASACSLVWPAGIAWGIWQEIVCTFRRR